jgi:hypothetical protein
LFNLSFWLSFHPSRGEWLAAVDYWSRRRGTPAQAMLAPLQVTEGKLSHPLVITAAVTAEMDPELIGTSDQLFFAAIEALDAQPQQAQQPQQQAPQQAPPAPPPRQAERFRDCLE